MSRRGPAAQLLFVQPRQAQAQLRALSCALAGGEEVTVVGPGDGAADGKPDPGAAVITVTRCIDPVEAVEDAWQVFGGYPLAVVAHSEDNVLALVLDGDLDLR